jgi:hypothetical protein
VTLIRLAVRSPRQGDEVWLKAMPDHIVYLDGDEEIAALIEVAQAVIQANRQKIFEQLEPYLRDIAEDTTKAPQAVDPAVGVAPRT